MQGGRTAAGPAAAPPRLLLPGMSGGDVETLQTALRRTGFYRGLIDGEFGPETKAAVEAYQRARALTVDGIVGPATRRPLGI